MLLGVVSDTHGHVPNTLDAVRLLESLEVDVVIHCGDIGGAAVVQLLSSWPAHFVFGNMDGDSRELCEAIEAAGQTCHGRFGSIEIEGRRIAFLHGDDMRRFDETVASGDWDLVCFGHTHQAKHYLQGGTLVVNPGAVQRAKPHSIALISLPSLEVTPVTI